MRRIAKFQKVSWEQFLEGWKDTFPETEEEKIRAIYEEIRLPRRATAGSAGYDFFSPVDFELNPGETLKVPTGIRAWMEPDWVLKIYPRSGLGFRYGVKLSNTVGIIDMDYRQSIRAKITSDVECIIDVGEAFMQGILVPFGTLCGEIAPTSIRKGGFGSTDRR